MIKTASMTIEYNLRSAQLAFRLFIAMISVQFSAIGVRLAEEGADVGEEILIYFR
jgi:hypothetical protein